MPSLSQAVSDVTRIVEVIGAGQSEAADELLPLVNDELRRIAAAKMAQERPGQTLQPTALVHEAWLRLGGDAPPAWQNRAHFFAAAAEAMRRILVENARRKLRLKRGGDQERVELDAVEIAAPEDDERVIQVHEAPDALAAEDSLKALLTRQTMLIGTPAYPTRRQWSSRPRPGANGRRCRRRSK